MTTHRALLLQKQTPLREFHFVFAILLTDTLHHTASRPEAKEKKEGRQTRTLFHEWLDLFFFVVVDFFE